MAAAWVDTLVAAMLGGAGTKALDWLLARGQRTRDAERADRKDDLELASKIREELRKDREEAKKESERLKVENETLRLKTVTAAAAAKAAAAEPAEDPIAAQISSLLEENKRLHDRDNALHDRLDRIERILNGEPLDNAPQGSD